MNLTFDELIRFDLCEKAQDKLSGEKKGEFLKFLDIIQEINSINQFIKDFPCYPGSTDKIIREEMISAIGATLAIEGTLFDKGEIEESFKKADLKGELHKKEQEAENSRTVYTFVRNLVDNAKKDRIDLKYSEAIIKQIHSIFTRNINYSNNIPGEYRGEFSVSFGVPRRQGICRNRSEVEIAMQKFTNWINSKGASILDSFSIVKAIMAHYYLAEIHPFGDGNGRTARAMEALVLYVNGMNEYCFWSLANFWSRNRGDYIVHLGNIYKTKNPIEFILWGLAGFKDEIKRIKLLILKKVKQLMLMDYTNYLYNSKKKGEIKINERIIDVMRLLTQWDKMPLTDFILTPEISAYYKNVKKITQKRDLRKMEEARLIKVKTEGNVIFIEPNFSILEQLTFHI